MASPEVQALTILAEGFQAAGNYLQAAKCYQAICNSRGELPNVEGQARLQFARLLLRHFDNVAIARQHLERAQLLLNQTSGMYSTKCEILSELGHCQRYQAETHLEVESYRKGLEVCRSGAHSEERDVLIHWMAHFHSALADAAITGGNNAEGLEWLEVGLSTPQLSEENKAILQLSKMQLFMLDWNQQGARELLVQCSETLKQLAARLGQTTLTRQLSLHYACLRALFLLANGQTSDLQKEDAASVTELEALHREIGGEPWQYPWLSVAAVAGLVNLLAAVILRPAGKFKAALMHLSRAQAAVEGDLSREGMDIEGGEGSFAIYAIWECRVLLVLKLVIAENSALIHLTRSDLVAAQREILTVARLLNKCPTLLFQLRESYQTLAGHYAHSCGDFTAAAARFRDAVELAGRPEQRGLAAVNLALSLLSSTGPQALSEAIDALSQQGLYNSVPTAMVYHERAAALYVSGLALLEQGEEEGKLRLTKALKLAHSALGNHQMVSQVLNALAPQQLARGDTSGAENMLTSSLTLAKNLLDHHSKVEALRGFASVYTRTGNPNLPQQQALVQQQETALAQKIAAARANAAEHACILEGRLS